LPVPPGLFARVSLLSHPNWVVHNMPGSALSYETARSSQKKRYETVAQLPPDHLTYTDGEIQVTPICTVWRGSQAKVCTRGGRSPSRDREEGNNSCQEHDRQRVEPTFRQHRGCCTVLTQKNELPGYPRRYAGPPTPTNYSFGALPSARRQSSAGTARSCRNAGQTRWTTRLSSVFGEG
jgi:hypothetical protein